MTVVTIHAAKTNLSKLIEKVSGGEEVIIAKGSTPVARLVPYARRPKRVFGAMKGEIAVGPEFFEPLPGDILKAWNDPE